MKIILSILLGFLTACSTGTSYNGRAPLNLPNPPPLNLKPVHWNVLPRSDQGTSPDIIKHTIIFGLSETGYKSLAENVQNIINFIGQQGKVLDSYRKYYEQDKHMRGR